MSDEGETIFQRFVRVALAQMPRARDHYDSILQTKLETKGEPFYDVQRGKVRRPGIPTLRAMAEALGQPLDLLVAAANDENVEPAPLLANASSKIEAGPRGDRPDTPPIQMAEDDGIRIRQLDLSYAMGPGTNTDDYAEDEPVVFDPNFLRAVTRADPSALFVARSTGDSMFPTLINDDQVLIDTTQREIRQQDRIWAVSLFGASMIKRLRKVDGGKVRILSDNTAVPPDEVEAGVLHVVGRVIWVGRRV